MQTLETVINFPTKTKDVEIGEQKIKMKLLTSGELQECYERTASYDDTTKMFALQKHVLARSLFQVNGEKLRGVITKDEEETMTLAELERISRTRLIQENMKTLNDAPQEIVRYLYEKYTELMSDSNEDIIEWIKKKEKMKKVELGGELPNILE